MPKTEIMKLAERKIEEIALETGNFVDTAKVIDEMERMSKHRKELIHDHPKETTKARDKELTPKDIEEAIKKKRCPYCGSKRYFNATIWAYRDFYFDEKGKVEWCDDIETPGDQGDRSDLIQNPSIICGTCCKEIPKEVWEKWFERG